MPSSIHFIHSACLSSIWWSIEPIISCIFYYPALVWHLFPLRMRRQTCRHFYWRVCVVVRINKHLTFVIGTMWVFRVSVLCKPSIRLVRHKQIADDSLSFCWWCALHITFWMMNIAKKNANVRMKLNIKMTIICRMSVIRPPERITAR